MKTIIIIALLIGFAPFVSADPYDYSEDSKDFAPIKKLVEDQLKSWINDPIVVEGVKGANWENRSRTEETILEQDQKWRSGDQAFRKIYLENPVSDYLREVQEESAYLYAEIFVMDFQGCNVGQTGPTSDFWQGDEAKFQKSYNDENGAVFIDEIEFDDSSGVYVVQVSLPIVDPENSQVIGAVTIGVDMSKY